MLEHYSPVHGKNSAVLDVLRDPADSMRTGKGMHLDGPFGRSFVAYGLLPTCYFATMVVSSLYCYNRQAGWTPHQHPG